MPKTIKRSIRISSDVDNRLKEYCDRYNFSYSRIINIILESFVYENK